MNFTINSFEAWGIVKKPKEKFCIKTSDNNIKTSDNNYIEVDNNEIKDLRKLLDLVEDALKGVKK